MEWDKEQLMEWWRAHGLVVSLGFLGVCCLFLGWKQSHWTEPGVEVVEETVHEAASLVSVDVAGAVGKPGLYQVPEEFRIGDLLREAGGVASGASQAYVAQVLNQAQSVSDGMKLFIPFEGEVTTPSVGGGDLGGRVNVNTATKEELDKLTGIGPARAEAIIKNRPYHSLEELVEKSKTPATVLEQSRDKILF